MKREGDRCRTGGESTPHMSGKPVKTKPCFLEGGLPCASLSAECNNARQRPPQNRLHIWWARRPPTISRAAVLSALLPYDLSLDESVLPAMIPEPSEEDLENLPPKLEEHREFFRRLLDEVEPTPLSSAHQQFLRVLGVTGDSDRAFRRLVSATGANNGKDIILGSVWGYRHLPAFSVTPSERVFSELHGSIRKTLGFDENAPITVLDFMAGGATIPLEAVRYGLKVFANELNPVAAIVIKATIEYPTRYSRRLSKSIFKYAMEVHTRVKERLSSYFPFDDPENWWSEIGPEVKRKFKASAIVSREPAHDVDSIKNTYLWLRLVPCPKCNLKIPISTNLHIVNRKGKSDDAIAAFPKVPERWQGNDCSFRIVKKVEWKDCRWPRPDFDTWHPRNTPTFKDGNAICPRCGNVIDGDKVKEIARSRPGGLPARMYAVCSQVPVKLTYQNGDVKIRYLWRFRTPTQADLDAVKAAEAELARLLPKWEAQGLVPDEEIPLDMEDKRPREYGMTRWRDIFLPRQLLTNLTILEEIRAAQHQARKELPEDEAEAVSIYLAFVLSKVVNYNSVNTFWDYTRNKGAQTFSRHDFAFRAAFSEFEGARETVMWGASQIINAYEDLARLIHGEPVDLSGDADEDEIDMETEMGFVEEDDTDDSSLDSLDSSGDGTLQSSEGMQPGVSTPGNQRQDHPSRPGGAQQLNEGSTTPLQGAMDGWDASGVKPQAPFPCPFRAEAGVLMKRLSICGLKSSFPLLPVKMLPLSRLRNLVRFT
jgi:putative DNA methylase